MSSRASFHTLVQITVQLSRLIRTPNTYITEFEESIDLMATQPRSHGDVGPESGTDNIEEDEGIRERCDVLWKEEKPPVHDSYKYRALGRPQETIRFLAWPANPEDLPCLLEAPITNLPAYETVSYAWGSSGTTGWPLELNKNIGTATSNTVDYPSDAQKSTLLISVTVIRLLRALRPVTGWRILWIDARNTHVQSACKTNTNFVHATLGNLHQSIRQCREVSSNTYDDRIYIYAKRVLIWCPKCRVHRIEGIKIAIDKLNLWKDRKDQITEDLENDLFGDAAYYTGGGPAFPPWKLPPTHELFVLKICVEALECLLCLPWFERV